MSNDQRKNGKNKIKKQRILRLLLILVAIFIVLAVATGFTTYTIVAAYMEDIPEFDPEQILPSQTSFIYDKDGNEVTPLLGAENRIAVSLDEISEDLINAFIAIEDERFYDHPGFDVRGITRAAYHNFFGGTGTIQGGSTITQQLVKNAFLTTDREMKRKVQELYIAYQMERSYTKEEILEFYLNRIFFDFNAYGVEAAAQTYFGKSASDVTLAEAAILAGIPNLPGRYSPYRNLEESQKRQSLVLNRMVDLEMITAAEAQEAREEELELVGPPKRSYSYQWFIDSVVPPPDRRGAKDNVLAILASLPQYDGLSRSELYDIIYRGGLRIYTTLDPEAQKFAEETINNPDLYTKRDIREEGKPVQNQAAMVIADPKTGYVSAIVGGREYDVSTNQINRAIEGRLQAGSTIKPIVAFAPAFNEGVISPGTVVDDAPKSWPGSTRDYQPNNFDRRYQGLMTVRTALLRSRNIPAVSVLHELGLSTGKDYAQRMGIESLSDEGLSVALGSVTTGTNPYEMAQAFAVLANEGVRTDLTTVTRIEDSRGNVLYEYTPTHEEILSPQAAWLTTDVLVDAVRHGTAAGFRIGRTVAAKTGTSDNKQNVWLAAYTPDYVAVFWQGRDRWDDRYEDGGLSSGADTNPFMIPIMRHIHEDLPDRGFERPDGLRRVSVSNKSGLLPSDYCPKDTIVSDWFLPKNVPTKVCDLHVELEICSETGLLASDYCPAEHRKTKVFFDRPEFESIQGRPKPADADDGKKPPKEVCDQHTYRPGDVSNLRGSGSDDGKVSLSWDEAKDASGYLIFRERGSNGELEQITSKPIKGTSYTDKKLSPGAYTYQVVAVSSEGVTSSPASVSVLVDEPKPEPEPDPEPDDDDNDDDNDDNDNDNNGNENRGRGNNNN
ncbi:transglycosylase domain-containing protein [Dethiobacter alkaliphilus]|uniref:Penicillin-binding protein, 1A family n=1 Tax=Dethiobacter alkaliphilus AHT 1 TaxID=555088 RepID=C0GJL6_DETAL|nr:penicillin-binding protein 1A [Dethiobacter alkaliphilus]EEG76438.1 penicillin-binding protein, 1A family [Dethiobacter alkaliphilus AHT 1]